LASDTQITFGWDDYSTVSKKLAKLLDSRWRSRNFIFIKLYPHLTFHLPFMDSSGTSVSQYVFIIPFPVVILFIFSLRRYDSSDPFVHIFEWYQGEKSLPRCIYEYISDSNEKNRHLWFRVHHGVQGCILSIVNKNHKNARSSMHQND
jgi:hypothetical protein